MVEYPLNVIFSAGIVFFIPLQGYEKRHERAARRKSLYDKIAVCRRLVSFIESVLSVIVKLLAVARRTVPRLSHIRIFPAGNRLPTFQRL